MRGLVLGQLRQVHQHRIRRAEHDGPRQRRRAGIAGRQIVGRAILPDGLDAPRLGIGDGDEPQIDQPPVVGKPDRVGRIKRETRRRQTERRRLPTHPRLHQRAAAAPLGFLGRHGHREGLRGDPASREERCEGGGIGGQAADVVEEAAVRDAQRACAARHRRHSIRDSFERWCRGNRKLVRQHAPDQPEPGDRIVRPLDLVGIAIGRHRVLDRRQRIAAGSPAVRN